MNPRLRNMMLLIGTMAIGCAPWPPEGWVQFRTVCGLTVYQRTESWITESDVNQLEFLLTHYISKYEGDACSKLNGNVAHELDGNMTEYVPGRLAAGWAECWNRRLFYHRGIEPDTKPWNTALWHEMIHIVQGCPVGNTPPDDEQHPEWTNRGYWNLPYTLGLR